MSSWVSLRPFCRTECDDPKRESTERNGPVALCWHPPLQAWITTSKNTTSKLACWRSTCARRAQPFVAGTATCLFEPDVLADHLDDVDGRFYLLQKIHVLPM